MLRTVPWIEWVAASYCIETAISAENTVPRLCERDDRARHCGFAGLSTAVGTRTTAITAGAVFAAGFLAFAFTTVLTFTLGDASTFRGMLRISSVSEAGADRTAS